MSTFNELDIDCASCGEEFKASIWVAVHAQQDPELKELLLGGELNLVSCPACGHIDYQEHFLLYQDPPAELIAYVYPEAQRSQADDLRATMFSGFREAQATLPTKKRQTYDPVLLFGLESLVEMLEEEELRAEQSQIAQALCKENRIAMLLLRPAHARRLKMMRVLPHTGSGRMAGREDILEGLDKLLAVNPTLDLYARLRENIQKDAGWSLGIEKTAQAGYD